MTQDPFVTLLAAKLILASSSQTRKNMLATAGIAFTAQSATVDEAGLRDAALAEDMAKDDIAVLLAEMKAQAVSMRLATGDDSYVLGADQLLVCDDVIFAKPENAKAAAQHLNEICRAAAGADTMVSEHLAGVSKQG